MNPTLITPILMHFECRDKYWVAMVTFPPASTLTLTLTLTPTLTPNVLTLTVKHEDFFLP